MTKLLTAMDVSGSSGEGNHKFFAIVICTQEHLNSLKNRLKFKNLSLNQHKNTETRLGISSELQLAGNDCLVICCKIERDKIIDQIKKK